MKKTRICERSTYLTQLSKYRVSRVILLPLKSCENRVAIILYPVAVGFGFHMKTHVH